MVNWINLCAAIAKNTERTFHIKELVAEEVVVDTFKLVAPIVLEEDADDLPPPPPPTKSIGVVLPLNTHSISTTVHTDSQTPVLTKTINTGAAAAPRVKHRLPLAMKQTVDPIVVGLELVEPLYSDSSFNSKHSIEIAAAVSLEQGLNELYKSEGGRSRGWTKSGLDLWIKPRCASGGNLKELDRAKAGFAWQLLMDDKAQSSFLDFVCVGKRIRIAVWFEETKTVLVYPAADLSTQLDSVFPLYNISSLGNLMKGPRDGAELYAVCEEHKYTVLPPLSVMSSLNGLKVEELENVGKNIGMSSVEGKKTERIAAIAAFKLRQRFGL